MKFEINKKLDNNRIPCNVILTCYSYTFGDKEIKKARIKYTTRSGWCLDSKDSRGKYDNSISFTDIGKLRCYSMNGTKTQWEIYTHKDEDKENYAKLFTALYDYKQTLLKQANQIPV